MRIGQHQVVVERTADAQRVRCVGEVLACAPRACDLCLAHYLETVHAAVGELCLVDGGEGKKPILKIAQTQPLAVQAILRAIRETEGLNENDAFKIDTQIGIKVFLSDDAKEGPRAFAEKRKPNFQNR